MINHQALSSASRPSSTRAEFEPSRTSAIFAGELEPVDRRQTDAFDYTVDVAIDRQAYDTAICRDDDSAHVDINARTVDVLWWAKIALDAHPFPQWLPFIVWPADRPINLAAIRGTGDMGEDAITIVAVDPISPFSVKGTSLFLPALHHQVGGGRFLTPQVTVSVLHVVLAALLDTEQIVTFTLQTPRRTRSPSPPPTGGPPSCTPTWTVPIRWVCSRSSATSDPTDPGRPARSPPLPTPVGPIPMCPKHPPTTPETTDEQASDSATAALRAVLGDDPRTC